MDRQIVKSGQIPLETDFLASERSTMIALGWMLQGILGINLLVDGLACTPSSPASMVINVGPGQIFQIASVDASSYSSLNADTAHQIVKQGLAIDPTAFTLTAPPTSGQAQNYLVQAGYSDVDDTPVVRPYYNSANPPAGLTGPGGSGASDNTFRRGKCVLAVKAGSPGTSGSQVTPTPDPGYVGLYTVTVANGVTTVTSGNIAQLSTAPFINPKLPAVPAGVQNASWIGADDTGAVNALAILIFPTPSSYAKYQGFRVKIANTNTGPATINVNGQGTKSIVRSDGNSLTAGELVGGAIAELIYDGSNFQLLATRTSSLPPRNLVSQSTAGSYQFTVPAGIYWVYCVCVGAGGGAPGASTSGVRSSGGGGSGGTARGWIPVVPGQIINYIVGAGGSGTAYGVTGNQGGTSSIGAVFSAVGGSGGFCNAGNCGGGLPGAATGGQENLAGSNGGDGNAVNASAVTIQGGQGASSSLGGGGRTAAGSGTAANGVAPGSGGGGGWAANSTFNGGNGADGLVSFAY